MIAHNIKFIRKKHGLSQQGFADQLGVSRQSVAKWENAESSPDISKCVEIADRYDLSLDALIRMPLGEQDFSEHSNNGKHIFGIVKVGERGQIVIPKYAREVFGITSGDRLMVLGDEAKGGIALAKISLGDCFVKE